MFRALGGLADNVSIHSGPHGQGVYAVNSGQRVRLVAPPQLLISPTLLQMTPDGQIKVKPEGGLRPEVVAFHEYYQQHFGWGAGGFAYISQHRQQLRALPDALKPFLRILGCSDDLTRQLTPAEAFNQHCISRQISVNGTSQLMPMLELVNHANEGQPYVISHVGVSLAGVFDGEVLARYREMDAFHFFFNYHFATPGRLTLSCDVRIEVPGFRALRISRMDGLSEVRGGVRLPRVSTTKGEVHLTFVELANSEEPTLPRQVFLELLKGQSMPTQTMHELFDGLLAHNRQVLADFLEASEGCQGGEGAGVQALRKVAGYQLTSLQA